VEGALEPEVRKSMEIGAHGVGTVVVRKRAEGGIKAEVEHVTIPLQRTEVDRVLEATVRGEDVILEAAQLLVAAGTTIQVVVVGLNAVNVIGIPRGCIPTAKKAAENAMVNAAIAINTVPDGEITAQTGGTRDTWETFVEKPAEDVEEEEEEEEEEWEKEEKKWKE